MPKPRKPRFGRASRTGGSWKIIERGSGILSIISRTVPRAELYVLQSTLAS